MVPKVLDGKLSIGHLAEQDNQQETQHGWRIQSVACFSGYNNWICYVNIL